MASIVQRNNRYNVVYLYDDEATGKRKQKWESFKTMADAKRRKAEIEYRQEIGTMVIHQCKTVDELLKEYVDLVCIPVLKAVNHNTHLACDNDRFKALPMYQPVRIGFSKPQHPPHLRNGHSGSFLFIHIGSSL